MAASRTCTCSGYVLILQGMLVVVNFAVAIGLTLDMGLTRQQITTSLGQPTNLGCYANQTNTTSLTYSWSKDNLTVTQSSSIRVYGNVLVVTPKKNSDFGMYQCHVSDGVTITKCNISLLSGCNNTEHEENPQGQVGCANIAVLMPVLAVVVVSLLLNVHFLIRWKRRERWVLSEEDIMQLQLAQEPIPVEEKIEEPTEIKKKKPFFGRLRKRRRENYESDQHIEENDKNHEEIACDSDLRGRGKHKEEAIEMQDIPDIPSVAEIKAANEEYDETAPAQSEAARRPPIVETPRIADFFKADEADETAPVSLDSPRAPVVAEPPRIADFFQSADEENESAAPTPPDTPRTPVVAEPPRIADFFQTADEENDIAAAAPPDTPGRSAVAEPPRIADFFVPDDDTDGEVSGRESMDSEEPLVSHYMEKMVFEGKGDSDDEPVLK